ncbi:MAG: hypothetical protein ACKVX7_08390 [Planctomycetota bacterium]
MKARQLGSGVLGLVLVLGVGVAVAIASAPESRGGREGATLDPPPIRLGTYESRAIAVAYVHSRFNTIVEKLTAELKAAEAAGDQTRAAEIRKQGERRQRQLHRQGFSNAPVDDLMVHIKDKLPAVCAAAKVQAIVAGVGYAGPEVEVVDVTDQLVKEFAPTERTLKMIAELRRQPVVDFDDLSHDH